MRLPKFLTKENPAMRVILAIFGPGQAIWTRKDYAALSEAGYQNCATVFACVSTITKAASRVEWTLSKKAGKGNWNEFDEHPMLDLLSKPNEREGGIRFGEKVFSFLLLNGNSYITKVHGVETRPPRFLYTLRPDRMTIIAGKTLAEPVLRYDYAAGAATPQPFLPGDILHLAEFHPLDDWYGLSRIEVAARHVDINNTAMEWNKKLLQNDMRPPGVISAKRIGDIKKFRDQFKEKYQGYENAGVPVALEGDDIKWENISINPKDVDWLNGQKFTIRQICSIFGVDPCLVGDSEFATYSNKQEAQKGLYTETVLPLMDIYRDELNSWLVPLYGDGLYLDYDRDKIEAIQEDRGKKYTYLAGAKWLTINEKRVACGYDEVPGGDIILVGMGDIPLDQAIAEPEPPPDFTPADNDDDDDDAGDNDAAKRFRPLSHKSLGTFWRGETERKALWQNFERRITAKERVLVREMQSYLKAQAEAVVAKAATGVTLADNLLNRDEAEKSYVTRFKARYAKLFVTALAAGRRMTEGKLYDFTEDDKADEPGISDALRRKLEKLIEETARVITDETLSEIQAVLREATGTNLTIQEIANALKDKLVDQMSPVRARRIARTETGMLENYGNLEGFKENEYVNRKMWLCSFVEASRDAHIEADGQEVGIDDAFKVGPDLMDYPLDRSHGAQAGNVINCLCAIAPVVE